jgi:hypothetical protein
VTEAVQLRHETRGALVVPVSDRAVEDRNAGHAATLAPGKPMAASPRTPAMQPFLHTRFLLVVLAALPLVLTACGKGGGY